MELIGQRRWAVWMMTHLRHPRTQTARGVDVAEGGALSSCGSAAASGQGGRQPLHLQVELVVGLHHQSCSLLGSSRASSNISRRGSRGIICCNSSSCNNSNSRGQAGVQRMQQQQGPLQAAAPAGAPSDVDIAERAETLSTIKQLWLLYDEEEQQMPAWRNPLTPRAPGQSSASQAPSLAGPRWRRLCGSRSACLQEDATTSGGASASALYYTGAWSSRGGPALSCHRRGWVILILHHYHGPAGRYYYNGAVTRGGGPGASVATGAGEGALRMPLEVVGAWVGNPGSSSANSSPMHPMRWTTKNWAGCPMKRLHKLLTCHRVKQNTIGHAIGNGVNVLMRLLPRLLVAAGLVHPAVAACSDPWKRLTKTQLRSMKTLPDDLYTTRGMCRSEPPPGHRAETGVA
jgi:hypothetical protein